MNRSSRLPEWTATAGGADTWKKWIATRVRGCRQRATLWAKQRGRDTSQMPSRAAWREAILDALRASDGRGHYSKLPLSLDPSGSCTEWNWPSLDHVDRPNIPKVVLETRLVNDMKTIMADEEFRALIGHLAKVLNVVVEELAPSWRCKRSFAVEQGTDEPPLPA